MASSRGMLINNERISWLAIKESLTLCSLEVKSLCIGTRNLAILYVGVPMTERIGRKAGQLSITFL